MKIADPLRFRVVLLDTFTAVDVEIASRRPVRICAIGAVRIEAGREVAALSSLVHTLPPVHYSRVHGLTPDQLACAPPWTSVWAELESFLRHTRDVVAFHAEFDRGALLAMCAQHGLGRVPHLRWICAAAMSERRLGRRMSLAAVLERLGSPFPGRPHDALSDARAAAALALACTDERKSTIRLSRSIPARIARATRRAAR